MNETYRAAHEGAVFRHRHHRGVLRVTGADRLSWLNGLVTNDVGRVPAGGSSYGLWLTPQGRIVSDLVVLETGAETLLDVPRSLAAALSQKPDLLVFAEDVRVVDASDEITSIEITGPRSDDALSTCLASGMPAVAGRHVDRPVRGRVAYVLTASLAGHLECLAHAGAVPLDDNAAETLRVEAGMPEFLVDMTDQTIPLEAGLDDAISHTKGCYVGQEIIVRIRDLAHGRVARHLRGLLLEGDAVPPRGEAVMLEGRSVGQITSAVWSPALKRPIAMAMLHRDASAPETRVVLASGTQATVAVLPFVNSSS